MKLLDVNILLYAYNYRVEHHDVCRIWLEEALGGREPVAFPWQTVHAFIRITTDSRITKPPVGIEQAVGFIKRWLAHPNAVTVNPSDRYWGIFGSLLLESRATGALVMDVALAALAIDHGAVVCSTDRDFRRFPGLKLLDPLSDVRHRVQDAFKAGLNPPGVGAYR